MKAVNPHRMVESEISMLSITDSTAELFSEWKRKFESLTGREADIDSFIAGYFLGTNFSLRSKYLCTNENSIDRKNKNGGMK